MIQDLTGSEWFIAGSRRFCYNTGNESCGENSSHCSSIKLKRFRRPNHRSCSDFLHSRYQTSFIFLTCRNWSYMKKVLPVYHQSDRLFFRLYGRFLPFEFRAFVISSRRVTSNTFWFWVYHKSYFFPKRKFELELSRRSFRCDRIRKIWQLLYKRYMFMYKLQKYCTIGLSIHCVYLFSSKVCGWMSPRTLVPFRCMTFVTPEVVLR